MNIYNNPIIDRLPHHLRQYIVPQHYAHYTPVDHAVWRYVMRQNYNYLRHVAYYPYIPGLKKAGLTIEHIPDLRTMNDNLKQIGWGAVTVNGFIPSQAFMEFQAYRVLIIAADIRQLEHIEYTPAPDIIHESAGHAPIIGEPEYADYLQLTGEVGSKALSSKKDQELFEAIRNLAVLKELAGTPENQIREAEEQLNYIQNHMGPPSEMALLARLHWWTVEYGLIGDLKNYKIYGAGLLSSIGESVSCMKPDVKKLMYSLDAVNYAYDITQPQPQLFVTPDFPHLIRVLDTFSQDLSYRRGGQQGLDRAIDSGLTCTAVYSSGLQVTGQFKAAPEAKYIQTEGPAALAVEGEQLAGHGREQYPGGFFSPVGRLRNFEGDPADASMEDLHRLGIETGKRILLAFETGIRVEGIVRQCLFRKEKLLLIRLSEGTVQDEATGAELYTFNAGSLTMAVGAAIVSVFAGAADKDAFEQTAQLPAEMPVSQYSSEQRDLQKQYQQVRFVREGSAPEEEIPAIWHQLQTRHQGDWLLSLEMLELLKERKLYEALQQEIFHYLHQLKSQKPELEKLIGDGLKTMKDIPVLPGKS
ncbi:aromatic amino acid hydroxylase [Niabella terrae]